jgi:hypothetical protein
MPALNHRAQTRKQLVARAPNGTLSLFMRAYWPEKAILDGTLMPPKVESDQPG